MIAIGMRLPCRMLLPCRQTEGSCVNQEGFRKPKPGRADRSNQICGRTAMLRCTHHCDILSERQRQTTTCAQLWTLTGRCAAIARCQYMTHACLALLDRAWPAPLDRSLRRAVDLTAGSLGHSLATQAAKLQSPDESSGCRMTRG